MARSGAATRDRILKTAYRLFYNRGFTRVGVDEISRRSGVTKRTLYNHFGSKDALVAAVLDSQQAQALAHVQGWGDPSATTPRAFLDALFAGIAQWASKPRYHGSGYSRLTMELADLPGHPARHSAHRHKAQVEAWLADELGRLHASDPQNLARHAMLLIEGCMSLTLIHGDTAYVTAAAEAARQLAD